MSEQKSEQEPEGEPREVMMRRGWLIPTTEAEVEQVERAMMDDYLNALAARVLAMCNQRGWSLHWESRSAHLHHESTELMEAVRGKRGDVLEEAADVLLVLMSITAHSGAGFGHVIDALIEKVAKLETKPRYAGEEYVP